MKHDSLNLTAPHTARELAQAETEAGAMHAKQIASMIAEDAYLDQGTVEKFDPTEAVTEMRRGFQMIHDALADATRPRQAVGEVARFWLNYANHIAAAQIGGAA